MDLKSLVKTIQEFEGVSRKSSINNVISLLKESYNVSGNVVIDIGDDASAIDIGNNQVVLVAADGIWGQIMNVNPYWAGYCAVLVNVNDIAAMGGKPLAMVNIMSISNDGIYEDLLRGIKDGCLKFGVPMVGGHLHPDGDSDSLGVAIVGIAQKDKIITSFGAEVGDKVIVAIDLDGKPHEMFSLNWDTTYDKDSEIVQNQITAVQYLAEQGRMRYRLLRLLCETGISSPFPVSEQGCYTLRSRDQQGEQHEGSLLDQAFQSVPYVHSIPGISE